MRYVVDNLKNYDQYKGWICGHFLPENLIQHNSEMEINISTFEVGHTALEHYHPKSKMVLYIIKGKIKMLFSGQEHILTANDFAYLEAGVTEAVIEVFEPTTVFCVRTPSVGDNKVEIK